MAIPAAQAQTTWHVDDAGCPGTGSGTEADPFCLIQDCIDAAMDGDKCVVAPGTYFENINFSGKAITVQSVLPEDPATVDATVINGDGQGRVVTFEQDEGADSVLNGLTLTNGPTGIKCSSTAPSIKNCHITGNGGFGVLLSSAAARILSCRITGNSGSAGAGLRIGGSDVFLANCLIADNVASHQGGGMIIGGRANVTIRNCTIVNNAAGTSGGAITAITVNFSNVTISNSILWGNSAPVGAEINVIPPNDPEQKTGVFASAYNNIQGDLSDVAGPVDWGAGHLGVDPMFNNPASGDYTLSPASLCIDAGDPQTVLEPSENDLSSQDRVQHCRIDIGAHESPFFVDCNGNGVGEYCELADGQVIDANANFRPDGCEGELYADCMNCPGPGTGTAEDPFCSVQYAINSVLPGDSVVLSPSTPCPSGAYVENINFFGKATAVRSEFPDDPATVAATVIDGSGGEFSTVRFVTHEGPDAVLEGLTVTGGSGTMLNLFDSPWEDFGPPPPWGGGILCLHASPTIRACRITGNQATYGAGLASFGAEVNISGCVVSENLARSHGEGGLVAVPYGAGISLWNTSGTIARCRIQNNLVDVFGDDYFQFGFGAGIHVANVESGGKQILIDGCVVTGNTINGGIDSPFDSHGGGISARGFSGGTVDLVVRDSLVVDNIAPFGAGLFIGESVTAALQGITVAGNEFDPDYGDGIDGANATISISNSVVYHNAPVDVRKSSESSTYSFDFCDIGIAAGVEVSGPGNITADPLFVNAAFGNYHLLPVSPCVDFGDPDYVAQIGETDIDGDPRILGRTVDIGADEFNSDCNNNGIPDGKDLQSGTSQDCNSNGIPDECTTVEPDCNGNYIPDDCDIVDGLSGDCTGNGIPDECEPDCNGNRIADSCDMASGASSDCNGNSIPDECEADEGPAITQHPMSQEVAVGGIAIFRVVAEIPLFEQLTLRYQWRKDGMELMDSETILGSTFGTLHIFNVQPADAGNYDCVVTLLTNFMCSTSDTATLTVLIPCPADLEDDGTVGVPDLNILLDAWGPNPDHPADFDGDGQVRVPDLIALLAEWGVCP